MSDFCHETEAYCWKGVQQESQVCPFQSVFPSSSLPAGDGQRAPWCRFCGSLGSVSRTKGSGAVRHHQGVYVRMFGVLWTRKNTMQVQVIYVIAKIRLHHTGKALDGKYNAFSQPWLYSTDAAQQQARCRPHIAVNGQMSISTLSGNIALGIIMYPRGFKTYHLDQKFN